MNDSILTWIENKLGNFTYWNSLIKYRLDSVLCVNKEKNKIVTAILLQYVGELGVQDDIHFFYGVKIGEQWYFFTGATVVLPREFYQKDLHTPLSFEKLHQIAMKEVFSGYLVQKLIDRGFWKNKFAPQYEYEINEGFFKGMESRNQDESFGSCKHCKTFDEYVLYLVGKNWEGHHRKVELPKEKN